MRSYIYILVSLFICFSCKSQEKVIEYENKNLIIFKDIAPTIKIMDNTMSSHILTYGNSIYIRDRKYSDLRRPMNLSFVNEKDTMNIVFSYGNGANIYVKNFKFKKGNYRIIANIYTNPQKYILKKEELPKQNIVSKNVFIPKEGVRRDVELKDMVFYEVDLNDTINVKLTEIK